MDFFQSAFGQYLVQTVFHAAVIAISVEAMLGLWHIQKPLLQMKFRMLALWLPVLSLPLYYAFYPARTGPHFHSQIALIDANRWLGLRLFGPVYLWHFFAAALIATMVYFVLREAVPGLRYYLWHRHTLPSITMGEFPKLDTVLAKLGQADLPMPGLFLSPGPGPAIYTIGRRALVLSPATINTLDNEELEAALAHEMAHLTGQAYVMGQLALVLRCVMFYNPVALLVFRRLANDNEQMCDDIAVRATGKPLALASALLKVTRHAPPSRAVPDIRRSRWLPSPVRALPDDAHEALTRRRLERLAYPERAWPVLAEDLRLGITAALLAGMLFFIV
ncbi:MAG: M48 family metalloprotease [Chloroflexi bacterium]|nr:M48 family metalloprotease [Chloroflexota bacterium]